MGRKWHPGRQRRIEIEGREISRPFEQTVGPPSIRRSGCGPGRCSRSHTTSRSPWPIRTRSWVGPCPAASTAVATSAWFGCAAAALGSAAFGASSSRS